MSRFNLAKKLLPAKKAWKSLKVTFQSKLQKLNTSNAIKRTKTYCIDTLNSIRVIIPCKLKALIRRSPSRSRQCFYRYHMHGKSSSTIYVDELFPGHASMHANLHSPLAEARNAEGVAASSSSSGSKAKTEETTNNVKIAETKALTKQGGETSTSSATSAAANAWKIPLLPQLRCVDERAEEFISKFRQEMKLEREQSILDFQEMLARSI